MPLLIDTKGNLNTTFHTKFGVWSLGFDKELCFIF
jgi:hypothetical protein